MKIYILKGSTGMYEDSYEWVVRAYTSEDKAKEDCEKAEAEADEYLDRVRLVREHNECFRISEEEEQKIFDEVITVDPCAQFDTYCSTLYWVVETELVGLKEAA